MAISAVPFVLQNGSHPAALFRQALSSLLPNGSNLVESSDFSTTQTGTPSMAVVVNPGRAWVQGNNVTNITGTDFSTQGLYFVLNDGPVTLTIATSNPTNPRIDVVCITINDSFYSGSTNNAVLQVITGTPSGTPAVPAIPANSIDIAHVAVAANASSITNANITQTVNPSLNNFGALSHASWTCSNSGTSGAQLPAGTMTLDTANSVLPTGITSPSSGTIQLANVGIYCMSWMANFPAVSGTGSYMQIQNSAGTVQFAADDLVGGSTQKSIDVPNLYIPTANTQIKFVYSLGYSSASVSSTIRVTRIR